MRDRARRTAGFTLVEIVVVIAIAAALSTLLGVMAYQTVQATNENGTEDDLERIFEAIVGNPAEDSFGYLGDMGRLPTTLSELATQGSQLAHHFSDAGTPHVGNVGTGWRGPYVLAPVATANLFTDRWGQAFTYTSAGGTAGQIISAGADGAVGTADDIKYPMQLPVQTTGSLVVTVVVNTIPQPSGLTVTVFSTTNGEQVAGAAQTTAAAGSVPFRFTVPHGVHVVRASHTAGAITVTRTVTVGVRAGSQVSERIVMSTSANVAM